MVRLPPVVTSPWSAASQEVRPGLSVLQYVGYGLWLGGPLCIMLLAATMSVGPGRAVSVPGIGEIPETCTLHTRLGIDCPGCGLTRSFIHLAHGRMLAAWELNPVGQFLFVYIAGQIPLALLAVWGAVAPPQQAVRLSGRLFRWARYNQWLLVGLMLALVLRWGVQLVTGVLA